MPGSMSPVSDCGGPGKRREFLQIGLGSFAGLTLPGLLRLRVEAAKSASTERKAVILIWLPGGASHLETFDPKPLASSSFRGPYSPIPTKTPGLDVSELLPNHARMSDKFAILRSLVHTGFCHQQGTQQLLTGHPVRMLKQKPDNPDILAITNSLRFDPSRSIPNYVGVNGVSYIGPAYLGPVYEPFRVGGNLNQPKFQVPNIGLSDPKKADRLQQRIQLRQSLDRLSREVDRLGNMRAFDSFESQALDMLTSPRAREAFDLGRENAQVRDRYGRNSWGQQCLMARRLVESGVELITTSFSGSLCGRVGNWDDHAVNHHVFDAMKHRAPIFDTAVTALIEDLHERGLDKKVLLIVTGEFGRTPRISYVASSGKGTASAAKGVVQPGRDHWPRATSILFSGGGIPGGQVVGGTDVRGEDVVDRRVGRQDFLRTVYQHLGIDPVGIEFTNFAGRPVPIVSGGDPIAELTAQS